MSYQDRTRTRLIHGATSNAVIVDARYACANPCCKDVIANMAKAGAIAHRWLFPLLTLISPRYQRNPAAHRGGRFEG